MDLRTWVAFVLLETALCFAPGPAVLTVFSSAAAAGFRSGALSTAGILAANGLYFALSAAGFSALVLGQPSLFSALQWIGAGYLVFAGLRMLLATRAGARAAPEEGSGRRSFARAFAVQVSNPKALVFFGALVPQFMDASRSLIVQFWILGLTGGVIELCVLFVYSGLAAHGAKRFPGERFVTLSRRVAGAWLALTGMGLAISRLLA